MPGPSVPVVEASVVPGRRLCPYCVIRKRIRPEAEVLVKVLDVIRVERSVSTASVFFVKINLSLLAVLCPSCGQSDEQVTLI